MSTKAERFNKYMQDVDSYIKYQMAKRTEAERQAFRQKQIAMYDDGLERYAEKLKQAVVNSK